MVLIGVQAAAQSQHWLNLPVCSGAKPRRCLQVCEQQCVRHSQSCGGVEAVGEPDRTGGHSTHARVQSSVRAAHLLTLVGGKRVLLSVRELEEPGSLSASARKAGGEKEGSSVRHVPSANRPWQTRGPHPALRPPAPQVCPS